VSIFILLYLLLKEKKTKKFKNLFFKKLGYTSTEQLDTHHVVRAKPYYDAAPATFTPEALGASVPWAAALAQIAPDPMAPAPPK
jgi:hypothetical protein